MSVPCVALCSFTISRSCVTTWSLSKRIRLGSSFMLHMIIYPIKEACFWFFPVLRNWLIIQSPIEVLYVEIAMNVGSMRFCFIDTNEARRLKDFFIFSIVYSWLAITLRMLAKSPEQIIESTSKAVFFCSYFM